MGQKVNPVGYRMGIIYNWNSRWLFPAKKDYRNSLIEDIKIREGIMEKYKFAIVTKVEIERAINKVSLIINAVKPGVLIGKGGKGVEEIRDYIVDIIGKEKVKKEKIKIDIKIEVVKKTYLNAYYVAHDISEKLARSLPHRRVVHQAIDRVREAGALGIKVQLGGRIAGASISRVEKYFEGKVPLSTIKADIDYASVPSLTRSGYIGVKVWIYK